MAPPRPKVPPYLLMLVVSFALVGLIGYQTLRDRKLSGDLLLENRTLKELLKKEKNKASELEENFTKLSSQKEELNGLKEGLSGQLIELERVKSLTDKGKNKLETSLLEKESEIKDLKDKLVLLDEKEEELKRLTKEITQKDAEIRELKTQIKAAGNHSSEKLDDESSSTSESQVKDDDEKDEKKELGMASFGQGIAEKERDASEVDGESEDTKLEATTKEHTKDQGEMSKKEDVQDTEVHGESEDSKPEATTNEHTKDQGEMSKKEDDVQDTDLGDEESKVDDREETLANEDAGEEDDADKTRDEEGTDEQSDVDIDVLNKADVDENEMAAME